MKKHSKRYYRSKLLLKKKYYSLINAIALLKQMNNLNFNETIEAHFLLNIDLKNKNQQIRGATFLPHGFGKKLSIAVFAEHEEIKDNLDSNNIFVGTDSILNKIKSRNIDFDILITTPNLMPKLASVGKILGSSCLMPSLKVGTITNDLISTIKEFESGKIQYNTDKFGIVHKSIGKKNFSENQLKENIQSLYKSIEKDKPLLCKGPFIKSFAICSSMSPSIFIDLNSLK